MSNLSITGYSYVKPNNPRIQLCQTYPSQDTVMSNLSITGYIYCMSNLSIPGYSYVKPIHHRIQLCQTYPSQDTVMSNLSIPGYSYDKPNLTFHMIQYWLTSVSSYTIFSSLTKHLWDYSCFFLYSTISFFHEVYYYSPTVIWLCSILSVDRSLDCWTEPEVSLYLLPEMFCSSIYISH